MKSIAVVGGGMMGIASAIYLAESGLFKVSLFEKEKELGGLSSYYQWEDVSWDKFYHVILTTDSNLIQFVKKLGLENELFWRKTKSGFYGNGKLVSLSSSIDFLAFPFLSLWQKIRLVFGILYSTRIKDYSKLDKVYVRSWLTRVFGRRIYENIWDPLLRSKLGSARERTSASFIWATINRLYGARKSTGKVEKMGHVRAGYKNIINAAKERLLEMGVEVICGTQVQEVNNINGNTPSVEIVTGDGSFYYDKALLTLPCPEILSITRHLKGSSFDQKLSEVEYLSVICVLLVLNRSLSPYYVINLLDKSLPFTGIIEATNIVSPDELHGKHLVYLPKYLPSNDPPFTRSDQEILSMFVSSLKVVFGDLNEEEILHKKVFREKYVQPIQGLNYLEKAIDFRTPMANVYLANTSMIHNSTLNNNAVIGIAERATSLILQDSEAHIDRRIESCESIYPRNGRSFE